MLIDLIVGARPNFMKIPPILRAEETTVLDVPCLTLRDTSERPETVTIGTNELIGTNPPHLAPALARVMAGQWKKGAIFPAKPLGCYGDGGALGYRWGDFPEAERASREVLSLPTHPYLTEWEQDRIVAALKDDGRKVKGE